MPSKKVAPKLIRNMEAAQEVINRATDPKTKLIVYDAETTGLNFKSDVVVGHVLTFGPKSQDTYYIPVRHGGGGNVMAGYDTDAERTRVTDPKFLAHPFEKALKPAFADRTKHFVGHNFIFDLRMLSRHSIKILGRVECVQVNAAIANEFQPSFSLEATCLANNTTPKLGKELYQHLAMKFGGEPARSQMANYWRLAGDDMIGFDYAAGDGVATWEAYHSQIASLQRDDLDHIRMLESDVLRVIYRMIMHGVRINPTRLAEVKTIFQERTAKARKLLPVDFNASAPTEMKALLRANGIDDDQWPRLPPTEAMMKKGIMLGNPSFNEKFLVKHEIGRAVLAVRKYEHVLNSFIVPIEERHLWVDNRIRSSFNQAANDDFGTITFRFSSNDPNLQQIHKRNQEIGELVRSYFEADEDEEWLDADLSQIEPHLLAHYTQPHAQERFHRNALLVDGYLADPPVDAHSQVALAAFGSGVGDARENGKRLNQTMITGGGKNRVIEMLGEGGAEIFDDYHRAMPELKILQQDASNRFKRRGYLLSILRRRARLDDPQKAYKAVNRLLQVGNADILKKAMVDIDHHYEENGDVVKLLNTCHDSLSHSVPKTKQARQIAEHGLLLFTNFGPGRGTELTVPVSADYAYGKTWSEATYNKKGRMSIGEKVKDPRYEGLK